MKKAFIIALLVHFTTLANAQFQGGNLKKEGSYLNPIFPGDYADPSILRDGNDYYIVHSSFDYYPGLLIWHSKDLINWKPVTHALHKFVGAVWAPDLVKYKGKFYIYFPANNTNYVVTSDAIEGPWSEPVDLKIGNIDPGHIADTEGKRYLYFSGGCFAPLAPDGLSVIGEVKYVYQGWQIPRDWVIECFCMESPKIVKRGEYYYLTVAEGGTAGPATGHMVISARSKSPLGPWENSPLNPIIRTKDGSERWWSKGHATLVEDVNGKWWMVFHAYEKGHYNLGRNTLLEPIEWTKDGWFKTPDNLKANEPIKAPSGTTQARRFPSNDEFSGKKLSNQWGFYNEYDTNRFYLDGNSLTIHGKGKSVADSSPLTCVPSDHSYHAQVELEIEGNAIGGLVLFYNDKAYSGIAADNENVLAIIRGWQFPTEKKAIKNHVFLRLENREDIVNMYYSKDGMNWSKIENSLEVSSFNHNALGGFVGLRIGLCSIGEGKVKFKNFKYETIK